MKARRRKNVLDLTGKKSRTRMTIREEDRLKNRR
jgi:hypothetical protein